MDIIIAPPLFLEKNFNFQGDIIIAPQGWCNNCGLYDSNPILIEDFVKYDFFDYIKDKKHIYIRNISNFHLDKEILYLIPNENNKVLFAINKIGTEINSIFCENKKIIKDK